MTDQQPKAELKTLYQITGSVADINTVLINRGELSGLRADLERVNMQLAACGVVAMADTPDSAKKARAMHPDYESVSCDDVKRRVDECIELRARVAELEDMLANLPLSSLQRLRARIQRLEEMLAAVGAGGVGPLIPSKLTARDIADSALLGNIESPFNACMHQEHCKRWKKEAEAERQFSARDDAERLKSVARGMSYNDHSEAVWKHTLMEIAIRLETGGYAAFRATPELAQAQSGGISPDWKPVPVVPTEEMLDAGRNACEGRFYPQDMLHGPRAMMADRWVAMLDAAPQPPTTEQSSMVEQPQGEQEPVAVIGDVWTLNWVGGDPIATIVKKHGLKIGTKLYTHPQNLRCKSNQARLATLWGYVKEQPQQEQEWKRRLGNLLAVIHGDGGHYIDAHGWDKAQADAEEKAARIMTGLPQSASAVWPRNASEVRAFLSGHVAAERYARDDHQPDDSDTYTLSAHDLLGAIDWWTDFDQQPRQPLTDEQINTLFQWGCGQSFRDFARAIERAVWEKAHG